MSEDLNKTMQHSEATLLSSDELNLTDELVVDYLQDHPDFFNRQTELMTRLRLPDSQRGAVSLVERQLSQQRQKIHSLEEEITQLMVIANQNEQLFSLYSDLYLRLLDCTSANELLDNLHVTTTQLLSLSALKLWLVKPASLSHNAVVSNDCGGVLQNRLVNDYYFGRLQQSEQELIFGEPTSGSVVLLKLSHNDEDFGFLAISSRDAEHFDPRMDTLLLSQFRKLVAKLLYQQLN